MNKSPFSTPRGRGQNSRPYYNRKQRGHWNNKNQNSNYISPTNNTSQEDKNINTSGSSDDFIPFNNSSPSLFNNSLPSPSLSSPPSTLSTSSPFYHTQKHLTSSPGPGQYHGQHQRFSLGHNDSPNHSPRGHGNFNKSFSPKFNSRPQRGRNSNQFQGNNQYQGNNHYQGKNNYQGKKETNINAYVNQSFFEDPWAELVDEWEKTRSGLQRDSESFNESFSTDKLDDSSLCQSHLDDSSFRDEEITDSDCRDVESQDEEIFRMSQDDTDLCELKGDTSFGGDNKSGNSTK